MCMVQTQLHIKRFISQHLQNKPITIYGNGLQKRDFIHVEDLNKIILKLIKPTKVIIKRLILVQALQRV